MEDYTDSLEQEKLLKPKLYTYPDVNSPIAVFDFEELENTENMLVLCVRKDQGEEYRDDHVCYVWQGPDFDLLEWSESANMNENQFV